MTRIVFYTSITIFVAISCLCFLDCPFKTEKKFVQALQEGPLFWLGVIGLVLVISSLIYTGTFSNCPKWELLSA